MTINLMIHKSQQLFDNRNQFLVGLEVSVITFELLIYFLSLLESQLQLAFINQIYFNDKNPDDIFGPVHLDLVHQMIQSIDCHPTELSLLYTMLPPNFV